jgi:alkaline phosphatase D
MPARRSGRIRANVGAVIGRREFVIGALASGAGIVACRRGPVIRTAVPRITHGVQSGDVQTGRAVVWARCSEPARMQVEWDVGERFANPRRVAGPVVGPDSDHAGTVALDGTPPDATVWYRIRFEREAARGASAWAIGRFATPPAASSTFRIAWTGDTCGQGFGRNPEWGGLRGYAAIRDQSPAMWINSGDLIYADNPIVAEVALPDGRVWRNLTSERVGRVAQELDDFRARFAYNLEDDHVAALAAEVPVVAQWDDHETRNNWWPGQQLDDDRYTERDASTLAARARRAMFEWTPIARGRDPGGADTPIHRVIRYGPLLDIVVVDLRAFRTANDTLGTDGAMFGAAQARWLVDALSRSRARWKIVACDQPLALVIGDGPDDVRFEGFASGAPEPTGRERELAGVLIELARRKIENVVWLTADVHYAAAHRFDPARAVLGGFTPFWEFVAGPIHAGTFGPNVLDPTLGPELKFQWAPPPDTGNLPPWDGLQSFGTIDVSASALSVRLLDIAGTVRYAVDIDAR